MYTTATAYPWFHTLRPLALSLPPKGSDDDSSLPTETLYFRYRYVIHRAGVFYRYEEPSDVPEDYVASSGDVTMKDDTPDNNTQSYHQVPLRLLSSRESYVVNDVLGKTAGPPDIEHIRIPTHGPSKRASVSTMHSRDGSRDYSSYGSLASKGSGAALNQRKKAVGFAPPPPPYHRPKRSSAIQAVHLNSTDGLVVVSAFLPVILHRNDAGEWSADWDYEILLSMQTHLRVTRVGVVKWRGWHGNSGRSGSPEAGVPVSERWKVEECLRPFNCVPVWMDTSLFGEM